MKNLAIFTFMVLVLSVVALGQVNDTNSTSPVNDTNVTMPPMNDTMPPMNDTNITLPPANDTGGINDTNVTVHPIEILVVLELTA